jgi:hypothetical protein
MFNDEIYVYSPSPLVPSLVSYNYKQMLRVGTSHV